MRGVRYVGRLARSDSSSGKQRSSRSAKSTSAGSKRARHMRSRARFCVDASEARMLLSTPVERRFMRKSFSTPGAYRLNLARIGFGDGRVLPRVVRRVVMKQVITLAMSRGAHDRRARPLHRGVRRPRVRTIMRTCALSIPLRMATAPPTRASRTDSASSRRR